MAGGGLHGKLLEPADQELAPVSMKEHLEIDLFFPYLWDGW